MKKQTLFTKQVMAATVIQYYLSLVNIKSKKGVLVFQSKKDNGDFSKKLKNRYLNFVSIMMTIN